MSASISPSPTALLPTSISVVHDCDNLGLSRCIPLETPRMCPVVPIVYGLSPPSFNRTDGNVGLCAEHGCFLQHPPELRSKLESAPSERNEIRPNTLAAGGLSCDDKDWIQLIEHVDPTWKETIRPLLDHYTQRTPGS